LKTATNDIKKRNSSEDAYFGLFPISEGDDGYYISANRQGLELYATELLNASLESETIVLHPQKFEYNIGQKDWIDDKSDIYIDFVSPFLEKRKNIKKDEPYKETFKDKLITLILKILLIFLVICMIIGIVRVFQWIL